MAINQDQDYTYEESLEQAPHINVTSTDPEAYYVGENVQFEDDLKSESGKSVVKISMNCRCVDSNRTKSDNSDISTFQLMDRLSWRLAKYFYCFVVGKDQETVSSTADKLRSSGFDSIHMIVSKNPMSSLVTNRLPVYWGVHEYPLLGPQETLKVIQGTAMDIARDLISPLNFITKTVTYSIGAGGSLFVFYMHGLNSEAKIVKPDDVTVIFKNVKEQEPSQTVRRLIIHYNKAVADTSNARQVVGPVDEDTYWVDPLSGQQILTARKRTTTVKYGDTVFEETSDTFSYAIVSIDGIKKPLGGLVRHDFTRYTYDVAIDAVKKNKKLMRKESMTDYYYRYTQTGLKWKSESCETSYEYDGSDMVCETNQKTQMTWTTSGIEYTFYDPTFKQVRQTSNATRKTTETTRYMKINGGQTKVSRTVVDDNLVSGSSDTRSFETVQAGTNSVPNSGYPIEMDEQTIGYSVPGMSVGMILELTAPPQLRYQDIVSILDRSKLFLSRNRVTTTMTFAGVVRTSMGTSLDIGMVSSASMSRKSDQYTSTVTAESYETLRSA